MNLVLDLGTTILGESTLPSPYTNKINIQFWSFSASLPSYTDGSNQKRTFGKPEVSAVSISKDMDLSSTGIFNACVMGTNLPTVNIYILQEEGTKLDVYYTITLTDVLIESYAVSTGGSVPTESFSLTFAAISLAYKQQLTTSAQSGSKTASFDRRTIAGASS